MGNIMGLINVIYFIVAVIVIAVLIFLTIKKKKKHYDDTIIDLERNKNLIISFLRISNP